MSTSMKAILIKTFSSEKYPSHTKVIIIKLKFNLYNYIFKNRLRA